MGARARERFGEHGRTLLGKHGGHDLMEIDHVSRVKGKDGYIGWEDTFWGTDFVDLEGKTRGGVIMF
jgi:hypothetical protein